MKHESATGQNEMQKRRIAMTAIVFAILAAPSLRPAAGGEAVVLGPTDIFDLNGFNETIGSLAGAGQVTLGTGTLTTGGNNTSTLYTGVISGTGSLIKVGGGTMTLSGANIYSGTTTINGGILRVGAGVAGVINDMSAVTVGTLGTFDLNGFDETIGSLAGAGQVTLGAGTLTVGGSGYNNTAYSGTILGVGGSLTKVGMDHLTLTGANTYSGGTTLSAGGILIGHVSALGTGGVTVSAGATLGATSSLGTVANPIAIDGGGLTIDGAGNINFSGVITNGVGTGTLTKAGTGTLTLTGINTYTGNTAVLAGTLAGAGGLTYAAPIQGDILNNATVNFIQAANADYEGVMTGNGTLIKSGAARLIISGNCAAFTGNTNLNADALWLNGTLGGGTLTVANGATLGGTGTYTGNVVVNNLGTVGPGNSIGELTVANYNPAAGSILNVEVSLPGTLPLAADLLTVTAAGAGAATISAGATVYVTLTEDISNYLTGPTTYTIVQTAGAGGTIVGTFDKLNVPANTGALQFSLEYTPTQVNLLVVPEPKTYGVFIGSNDYRADGTITLNGQEDADAVYAAFSQLVSFDDYTILKYDVTDVTGAPQAAIENALNSLSGKVSPGDNLIFFYAGHGGGSLTDGSVDESIHATIRENTGEVLDDELTAYFLDPTRRDTWRDVNKLFILDSCHAGGFWGGEDADLSSLEHVALLAAASELEPALSSKDDNDNRQGVYSLVLADGLKKTGGFAAADTNKDGLTVQELAIFLADYPSYQNGITGFIRDGWPDDLVSIGWDPSLNLTDDFTMVVPEPATLSLLALGGLAMLRRRRGCGVRA